MKNIKKRVLILGGSSDIGVEVVKTFLKSNWEVNAHFFKNKKRLNDLKKNYNNLKTIKLDFSNFKNINFEKKIKKNFSGKFDSFINLVGYTDNKSFQTTNLKSILKAVTINALIPILVNKIIVKNMLKNNWGRILNCSSIGIKFGGGSNTYNYSLSKHCSEFIPNTYKNWAKKNVFINNLRIGVTDTKMHKRMKKNMKKRVMLIPAARMASPKEIASYILNLSTETNTYITGQTIAVSGGE